jgi:hypothetical protein
MIDTASLVVNLALGAAMPPPGGGIVGAGRRWPSACLLLARSGIDGFRPDPGTPSTSQGVYGPCRI